jgi:hypothetical protein
MPIYQYDIKTLAGEASGSVQAESEQAARQQLTDNHAGELVDADGKTFTNEVESLTLTEVVEAE